MCKCLSRNPIFPTGATTLTGSRVVDGTGQIVLDNLRCTGSESRLVDCSHNGLGVHNCRHSDDAGVRCSAGTSTYRVYKPLVLVIVLQKHGIVKFKEEEG